MPVSVTFARDGAGETWVRRFGRHAFGSHHASRGGRWRHLLVERFGPLSFGIALVVEGGRLHFVVRRWALLGLPLPQWLAPVSRSWEGEDGGLFRFDIELSHPMVGRIVRYSSRGSLRRASKPTEGGRCARVRLPTDRAAERGLICRPSSSDIDRSAARLGPRLRTRFRLKSRSRAVVISSATRPGRSMDHQNRSTPGALAGALSGVRDQVRARTVTAVLGPTNTGKTHFAIERMLAHPSGIIGLPLRLLAREVYGRVVEKVGAEQVALITGEEKIKPKHPRYWVCTVEAMPRDLDVSFVAIDEIQLCQDFDRGHVFTDRLLHRRGLDETLVLGAGTMQRMIERLLPGVTIVNRPRLSNLTFAGEKKLSRLPHRTAIVAFSADEVYAIAELIRRQRGGAAVVLGALSPRTRNAQVAMYQNGEVDYLIATDAIGMGLNLDVDHVAFAGERKFDGWQYRRLNPAEIGQIAGRAGRHVKDGTFGTTGRCPAFEEDLVEALEEHRFDPISDAAMAQLRPRLLLDRDPPGLAGDLPERAGPDPRAAGRGRDGARHRGARRDGAARRQDPRRRAAALGRVPGARLPQGVARRPCRVRAGALRLRGAGRPRAGQLVRPAGGALRPDRRRHRRAVGAHRPGPHPDLHRQPARLARRSGALAGRHASARGQAVRCFARETGPALRRQADERVDAALERECDVGSGNHGRRRRDGGRPARGPAARLSVHARPAGRRARPPRR